MKKIPNSGDQILRYFAYGSNMYSPRFKFRVPTGRYIGSGYIEGYKLLFHMFCSDGSGKCDAYKTGEMADRVYGVLYEFDAADKDKLDAYESLGTEYEITEVDVASLQDIGKTLKAFMYQALPQTYDASVPPYVWYKDIVISGAKEHHLPLSYIRTIEQVKAVEDPDRERSRKIRWGLQEE